MQSAKRGKHLRITRLPVAESDGRTGSIGTITGSESRNTAALTIDILPLDLGIFAWQAASEALISRRNYSS
jgi:hypothetical protein